MDDAIELGMEAIGGPVADHYDKVRILSLMLGTVMLINSSS